MTSEILFSPQPNFDRWLATARRASAGGYTRDAILGGLRARLFTNQLARGRSLGGHFRPARVADACRPGPPPQAVMSFTLSPPKRMNPWQPVDPAQSVGILVNQSRRKPPARCCHRAGGANWPRSGLGGARDMRVAGQRSVLVTGPGHTLRGRRDRHPPRGQIAVNDPVLVRLTLTRQVDGVQLAPRASSPSAGKRSRARASGNGCAMTPTRSRAPTCFALRWKDATSR